MSHRAHYVIDLLSMQSNVNNIFSYVVGQMSAFLQPFLHRYVFKTQTCRKTKGIFGIESLCIATACTPFLVKPSERENNFQIQHSENPV